MENQNMEEKITIDTNLIYYHKNREKLRALRSSKKVCPYCQKQYSYEHIKEHVKKMHPKNVDDYKVYVTELKKQKHEQTVEKQIKRNEIKKIESVSKRLKALEVKQSNLLSMKENLENLQKLNNI